MCYKCQRKTETKNYEYVKLLLSIYTLSLKYKLKSRFGRIVPAVLKNRYCQ